jgi:hypothetical protein
MTKSSINEIYLVSGSGLRDSHGDTEDGVSTELALVGGTVKLDEQVINLLLGGDGDLGVNQSGGNDLVDVLDSVKDTCDSQREPYPAEGTLLTLSDVVLSSVSELNGLVLTGGSTRGDSGSEETLVGGDVDLDGRVTCAGKLLSQGGINKGKGREGKVDW